MIAGVGLFATFTAYISCFFLESANKHHESEICELIKAVKLLQEKVDAMANSHSKTSPNKEAP